MTFHNLFPANYVINPKNVHNIRTPDDLAKLATANVITITEPTVININNPGTFVSPVYYDVQAGGLALTSNSIGAYEFRFLWYIDKNTGTFVPIDNPSETMNEIAGTAGSTSGTISQLLKKGYRCRPQITRTLGASAVTVRYATLSANS